MLFDGTHQTLCWVGPTGLTTRDAPAIRFSKGVLANERPVLVSPQHRILVSHWMAELHFGADEVLVPARSFLDGIAVTEYSGPEKAYFHAMLDRHRIINAEGAAMESLLLQDGSAFAVPARVRQDVGLRRLLSGRPYLMRAARPVLSVREGRGLLACLRDSSLMGDQFFSPGLRAAQRSGRLSRVSASDISRRHCATLP